MSENNGDDGLLELDAMPRSEVVKIDGQDFELKEASEEGTRKWRNAGIAAIREKGRIEAADLPSMLVQECLFQGDKRVKLETIRGWPQRVVNALFVRAKQLSEIHDILPDTEESLDKQIAELQARKEKLANPKN